MRHLLLATPLCAALTVPGQAQNAAQSASVGRELESIFTFETTHNGTVPSGWGGGPPGTISVDGETVHGGRWSVRLERTATNAGQPFSALTRSIPMEFSGATIECRGFLRSENVSEFMALWMRQDGDTPNLAFATMQPQQIKGTNDWTEYSITFPVHREATQLFFGVLIGGTGKVWADDLRDLVKRWEPYFPASNQPTRLRDMARVLTRGACATARLAIRRSSGATVITAQRQPLESLDQRAGLTHDLPGETFRLLSDQVAYLKLSSVQAAQTAS